MASALLINAPSFATKPSFSRRNTPTLSERKRTWRESYFRFTGSDSPSPTMSIESAYRSPTSATASFSSWWYGGSGSDAEAEVEVDDKGDGDLEDGVVVSDGEQ